MSDTGADIRCLLMQEFNDEERPVAFATVQHLLTDDEYWFILRQVYASCKTPYTINHFIGTLFSKRLSLTDTAKWNLMWDHERAQLSALPKTLKIYRGCWSSNDTGWNYTLNYQQAKEFALEAPLDGKPIVLVGRVHKNNIEMLFDSDGVLTVVVDPRKVNISEIKKVPFTKKNEERVEKQLLLSTGKGDPEWERLQFLMPVISILVSIRKLHLQMQKVVIDCSVSMFQERAEKLFQYGFLGHSKKVLEQMALLLEQPPEVEKWVLHFINKELEEAHV